MTKVKFPSFFKSLWQVLLTALLADKCLSLGNTLTLPWSEHPLYFAWSGSSYPKTESLLSGGRSGHSSQQGKPNCGVYSSQQASWSPSVMAVQGVCKNIYLSIVVCKDILEESVIAQQISCDDLRIICPLWGKFTGDRWITLYRTNDIEFWLLDINISLTMTQ